LTGTPRSSRRLKQGELLEKPNDLVLIGDEGAADPDGKIEPFCREVCRKICFSDVNPKKGRLWNKELP
jgi:hypothetical protein